MEDICSQFGNPFHRLLACTREVQLLCSHDGVPIPKVIGIAVSRDVRGEDLIEHLKLLGYIVEGDKVLCPTE